MAEGKSIAIITAREKSKRILNKNIRDFCGKPIIAYAISAALEAGIFDTVMVSTDGIKIAEMAKELGAEVPFLRSTATSDDHATTADVLLEVLDAYERLGKKYEMMSCIYPTAPFVTPEKLRQAMELLRKDSEAAMIMPVTAFSYPPLRGYVMKQGKLAMKWPEHFRTRSQDLESIYHDVGQFYCYRTEAFCRVKGAITEGILPFIINEMEAQDIDNETDWKIAEMKYELMKLGESRK